MGLRKEVSVGSSCDGIIYHGFPSAVGKTASGCGGKSTKGIADCGKTRKQGKGKLDGSYFFFFFFAQSST